MNTVLYFISSYILLPYTKTFLEVLAIWNIIPNFLLIVFQYLFIYKKRVYIDECSKQISVRLTVLKVYLFNNVLAPLEMIDFCSSALSLSYSRCSAAFSEESFKYKLSLFHSIYIMMFVQTRDNTFKQFTGRVLGLLIQVLFEHSKVPRKSGLEWVTLTNLGL